ncbi:MAG TPA: hypothetical protein VMW89_09330 [Desulfatiglandales bacterium]|nr:hypothetical protein [Desulfatiglandales bacterium]
MNTGEFESLIKQMKQGTVPRRLIFIWSGPTPGLEDLLEGIETHRCELVFSQTKDSSLINEPKSPLETFLNNECKSYSKRRNEPSALIVNDAILLARYGCDLSGLFRYGISPRSAVILVFPSESNRPFPIKAENWVKRNTRAIMQRVSKQLGEPKCIIEVAGG